MQNSTNDFEKDTLLQFHHEIRTPLNVLLGLIQVLADDENLSQSERKKYYKIMGDTADKLYNKIDGILLDVLKDKSL